MYHQDTENRTSVELWLDKVVDGFTTFDDLKDTDGECLLDEALLVAIWKQTTMVHPRPKQYRQRDKVRKMNKVAAQLKDEIIRRQCQIRMHDPTQWITGRQCAYLAMWLHKEMVDPRPSSTEDFLGRARTGTRPPMTTPPGSPLTGGRVPEDWLDKAVAYSPLNWSGASAGANAI